MLYECLLNLYYKPKVKKKLPVEATFFDFSYNSEVPNIVLSNADVDPYNFRHTTP